MVFSVHNLVCDQSFNEFELIMCRNVMIYFNKDLQNVALNLYSESQNNLGFLALGPNESILFLDANRKYKFHDAKHNIFQLMGPNQWSFKDGFLSTSFFKKWPEKKYFFSAAGT